jgi:hypothetical protein
VHLKDPPKLFNTNPKHIYAFHQIGYSFLREKQGTICSQKNFIDDLKNDIFHAWKVKIFHSHFDTVLDLDPLMDFILIIILDSKH